LHPSLALQCASQAASYSACKHEPLHLEQAQLQNNLTSMCNKRKQMCSALQRAIKAISSAVSNNNKLQHQVNNCKRIFLQCSLPLRKTVLFQPCLAP
jgi:hypothetical protein